MKKPGRDYTIPNQHWVRPGLDEPGLWRGQLPNKCLAVAVRGDLPGLRAMIRAHPDYLSKRGNHGRTLLWEAARRGRMPAVKWLVEQGAELDATGCYNSESVVQLTPYCAAAYYRRPEAAAYLLARGARLDISGRRSWRAGAGGAGAGGPAGAFERRRPLRQYYFVPLLAFAVAGGHAALAEWLLRRGAAAAPYTAQLLYSPRGRGGWTW